MATLKGIIIPSRKRQDGTYNVLIRLTHNRETVRISTSIYVSAEQVTRTHKIKDQRAIDAINNLVNEWRALIAELGIYADALSAKELADVLRRRNKDIKGFRLDFCEYIRKVGERKRAANTRANYNTTANTLQRFYERSPLDIANVTASLLRDFERWAQKENISQGSIHLYMSIIKAAHNSAKVEYNDEDGGIIRVPQTPFNRYKVPTAPAPQPRGVDLATLQAIADLPDKERHNARRNFARDLFMLSFGLGGMNVADMYDMPYDALKGDVIEYCRHKTREARADNALYRVKVLPEVRPLLDRWLDPTKKSLFRLHLRYKDAETCGVALGLAMGAVKDAVPFKRHYTFYAARHTYATLAYNVAGLDMYAVNELLNHSDVSMKITARYVERDWQRLFDAHDKVIKLIDWSKICKSRE
ncbi:MAG: phage integrase SAM-like domain-containing protein [Paludibacteraceae bacterium]|nr:phage integrase SAM-like domain-containing protein [Paludibacteraceae bacterium]